MNATAVGIEDKVDKLLDVLNEDIDRIRESLSYLNEIRALVIKRDDAALSRLLESIQAESNDYQAHELKRCNLRVALADALGCDARQVTLSMLEAVLPSGGKTRVTRTKALLGPLVKELKKEHLSTALLLSRCAAFNSLLLKSIFALGSRDTVTYSSNGASKKQTGAAFLNLQL